ncbi:MAG TPA: DNA translocase FtsK, partial [Chitinophagaceae bacterium]|nr:DNA translocase FtsK [Chitinophagaceae bacterium]
ESYNHPQTATNAPELRIPDEFFQHELPAPETTDRETENQTLEPAMDLTEPATTSIDLDPVLPAEMETDILPASKNKSAEAEKPMMQEVPLEVVHHTEAVHNSPLPVVSIGTDEPYDPSLELRNYKYPTLDLLDQYSTDEIAIDKNELEANKNQIINTLKSFGIAISKISATVGPTVTLYEIVPAEGVRISKIRNLEDDIALSLSALGIRIIAPIPGKGTIGIEVPNLKKQIVSMRTLIASEKFIHNHYSLPIALGKKIDNENFIIDLATMPHLLMAGATGQGKSVGINAILVSLLYKKHPSQVKFVMVDPKKVELSIYKLIEKHFLAKLPNEEEAIITDTKKVINTLNALCIEMDNRYDLLKDAGVRNIKEYNEKFIKRRLNPQKGHQYLPFIVLVVDEFADLIMTAGKEVEMPIARLAQLARAVGIHLIIATQRPSVNVITGTIKANFPGRIAFRVSAKVDSRTILDSGGAEQLIGRGDMLILQGSELVRVQCAFVDTPEVERVVQFIGTQQGYPSAFDLPEYEGSDADLSSGNQGKNLKEVDQMFEQCARLVVSSGSGSTSMLQRRFNLGYNRAGRIMDQLEAAGIVTAGTGGKPRDLLVHTETELDLILSEIRNR